MKNELVSDKGGRLEESECETVVERCLEEGTQVSRQLWRCEWFWFVGGLEAAVSVGMSETIWNV